MRTYGNMDRRLSVIAARVVLRYAICLVANHGSPGDWRFKRTAAGKLQIDNLDSYDCSISYTSELDAVAVSRGLKIGLDVESSRLVVSQDMLQSFFSEAEISQLESCESVDRYDGFLKTWVMKEAFLKLSGRGLSEDLKLIDTARCRNLLYSDGGGTRAVVFASRISELTGNSEQGWLSLAHEVRQKAPTSITDIAFYRVMDPGSV